MMFTTHKIFWDQFILHVHTETESFVVYFYNPSNSTKISCRYMNLHEKLYKIFEIKTRFPKCLQAGKSLEQTKFFFPNFDVNNNVVINFGCLWQTQFLCFNIFQSQVRFFPLIVNSGYLIEWWCNCYQAKRKHWI